MTSSHLTSLDSRSCLPTRRSNRSNLGLLLFATILGALIGGARVYCTVHASPGDGPSVDTAAAGATTSTSADVATTAAPIVGRTAREGAYQASYPEDMATLDIAGGRLTATMARSTVLSGGNPYPAICVAV